MTGLAQKIAGATPPTVGPPGMVPNKLMHLRRHPFGLLIDTSGSTGMGPNPDIKHINAALNEICTTLRHPPAGTTLAKYIDQIDVSFIAYADTPKVVIDWSTRNDLPVSVPPQQAAGGTRTGLALEMALSKIGERLRYYKANKIPSGLPHIIHLTDGAPTDMAIGDARWQAIQQRLGKLTGATNPESVSANIVHFIAPNGCLLPTAGMSGHAVSGQELLSQLSGNKAVFEMDKGITFDLFANLVTVIIEKVTETFGSDANAASDAVNNTLNKKQPSDDTEMP